MKTISKQVTSVLLAMILLMGCICFTVPASAETQYFVATCQVNIWAEQAAGSKYLGMLKYGDTVAANIIAGRWINFTYNGTSAWVAMNCMCPTDTSCPAKKPTWYSVTANSLNLRAKPSKSGDRVCGLTKGDTFVATNLMKIGNDTWLYAYFVSEAGDECLGYVMQNEGGSTEYCKEDSPTEWLMSPALFGSEATPNIPLQVPAASKLASGSPVTIRDENDAPITLIAGKPDLTNMANGIIKMSIYAADSFYFPNYAETSWIHEVNKNDVNVKSSDGFVCTALKISKAQNYVDITLTAPKYTFKLNKTKATLYEKKSASNRETVKLTANAPIKSWKSSNSKIAKVSDKGVVTALKEGQATITAKAANGKTVKCVITVKKLDTPLTKLTVTPVKKTLKQNEKLTVTLKLTPAHAYNNVVKWTSSNQKVAKVSSKGVITAVGKGTCVVTVKATDGSGKTAKIKITVK